eukprot:2169321-Rhodomonas_salina.1
MSGTDLAYGATRPRRYGPMERSLRRSVPDIAAYAISMPHVAEHRILCLYSTLRERYAMSGCYAMSSTDLAYRPTRSRP